MTVATAPLQLFKGAPARRSEPREPVRRDGPVTLEARLDRELAAALAGRPAACPACGGALAPAGDAARCGGCDSVLS